MKQSLPILFCVARPGRRADSVVSPDFQTQSGVGFLFKEDFLKTIFRTKISTEFTTLPNALLRDKKLSFKARGILAMILSHSDSWEVYQGWLKDHGTEGREAISAGMKELQNAGYAAFHKERDPETNIFTKQIWIFYDSPIPEAERSNFIPNSLEIIRDTAFRQPDTRHAEEPDSGKPATKNKHKKEVLSEEETKKESRHPVFIQQWFEKFKERFGIDYEPTKRDFSALKDFLKGNNQTVEDIIGIAKQAWNKHGSDFWNCKQAVSICGFCTYINQIRIELITVKKKHYTPNI